MQPEDITLIGDSAGGNLTAAVSLLARDRGDFTVSQQILIYPATAADRSESSPFPSVHENGEGYLLTSYRVQEFMRLYAGSDDSAFTNPYFAPLLMKDLSHQPRTLVITAEFDPLRDEGEAYAAALSRAGAQVYLHRMRDALHGFISLPARFVQVQRAHALIAKFLGVDTVCADKTNRTGTGWTTQLKFSATVHGADTAVFRLTCELTQTVGTPPSCKPHSTAQSNSTPICGRYCGAVCFGITEAAKRPCSCRTRTCSAVLTAL